MSPRDRYPVRTPSPRQPSGKDHWNQLSPYNLNLLQLEQTASLSGQRGTGPPTEPGFSQAFFLHSVTDGVLVTCLVGDTSFPAISSTLLHRYYLNWTELDDASLNNPIMKCLQLKIECLILSFYIIDKLFSYFDIVQLLWHNLYC